MSTISSFKSIEIKHGVYRYKDCMTKSCECIREPAMKIINFKKEKKLELLKNLLTKEQQKCYICKEKFEKKSVKIKSY